MHQSSQGVQQNPLRGLVDVGLLGGSTAQQPHIHLLCFAKCDMPPDATIRVSPIDAPGGDTYNARRVLTAKPEV
jgi:hypothetical protein